MKFAYQRLLIIASIIHICIGIFLGLIMYLVPLFEWHLPMTAIRSVHVHLILFGGVIQLIMGVALWMFPRKKKPPHYTSKTKGMILFILMNTGIVMRSLFELAGRQNHSYYLLALTGVLLQVLAMLLFFVLIITRIRKP